MHNLILNVNDEAYEHLLYFIKNISTIQIVEDKIIDENIENKNREEFLNRIKSSKDDIKNGRVSDFNFDKFLEEIDNV